MHLESMTTASAESVVTPHDAVENDDYRVSDDRSRAP